MKDAIAICSNFHSISLNKPTKICCGAPGRKCDRRFRQHRFQIIYNGGYTSVDCDMYYKGCVAKEHASRVAKSTLNAQQHFAQISGQRVKTVSAMTWKTLGIRNIHALIAALREARGFRNATRPIGSDITGTGNLSCVCEDISGGLDGCCFIWTNLSD